MGTINRMRFSADANVQKFLGLITDTFGAFAMTFTLCVFYVDCYADIPKNVPDGLDVTYAWGPGWCVDASRCARRGRPNRYCYIWCAVAGAIRMVAHWVTPLPGHGGRPGGTLPSRAD